MSPKTYRKKPVEIEAIEFAWSLKANEIVDWIQANGGQAGVAKVGEMGIPTRIGIETLEGAMTATVGDYIIQGVNGEFYPCKPDIFAKTYEEVTHG